LFHPFHEKKDIWFLFGKKASTKQPIKVFSRNWTTQAYDKKNDLAVKVCTARPNPGSTSSPVSNFPNKFPREKEVRRLLAQAEHR
jgi:hypothetical protein